MADDVRSAMGLVSSEFSSEPWPSRADLANYLNVASSRGYFDDAVALDDTAIAATVGNAVEIYPLSMRSSMGTTVFRVTLIQRELHWEISALTMEIY
jgi:hypothetical protein